MIMVSVAYAHFVVGIHSRCIPYPRGAGAREHDSRSMCWSGALSEYTTSQGRDR